MADGVAVAPSNMGSNTGAPASPGSGTDGISNFRRWSALAILLLFNVFGYIDRSIVSLLVQPIKAELLLSDVQISLVQGLAFAFFYAVCGLPIGWALDRFPKRPIVFAGIVIWSLASAACGLAQDFSHLLVARFFIGMGEATLVPASYAILAGLFQREQLARALSIFSLGTAIGMAIAMLAGGVLIELADQRVAMNPDALSSWRLVFLVTGLPGLLIAGLIFLVPDKGKVATVAEKSSDDGFWTFVRTRKGFLFAHYVGIAIACMVAVAVTAWMPTYLIREHGWRAPEAAGAMAFATVFSVVAMLAGGTIVDKMFHRGRSNAHMLVYAIVTPISVAFLSAGLLFGSAYTQLVLLGIGLSLGSMTGVGASALQLVTPPEYRARISAGYLMLYGLLGNGVGPLVTAFFTDYVYQDEAKLGQAMLTAVLTFGPISCFLFIIGVRFMRRAMDRLEAEGRA